MQEASAMCMKRMCRDVAAVADLPIFIAMKEDLRRTIEAVLGESRKSTDMDEKLAHIVTTLHAMDKDIKRVSGRLSSLAALNITPIPPSAATVATRS